jgi:hypothetical protein
MMDTIAIISLCSCLIAMMIALISLWFSGMVSGKYYDAKTKELNRPLLFAVAVGFTDRCARAGCYLLYILCNGDPLMKIYAKCGRKNYVDGYYDYFGRIDYRALARKRDWVMAILLWGSFSVFLTSIIILCIYSALSGST